MPDSAASPNSTTPTLARALGPKIAIAVVVGLVIGSGIFVKPGKIAADAGSFNLIISMWVFGGVLCIMGALCFAELAAMFPEAGGVYAYLREAYGRPVGFLYGWSEFVFAKPAAIGALSVIFVGSLGKAMGWKLPLAMQLTLIAVLIGGLAFINVMGVIWGGRLQMGITLIKAGFLALVAATPFVLSAVGKEGIVDSANYRSTVEPLKATLSAQAAAVLLAVMWAYHGWHGIMPLAEEVRDPQRNVPLALFVGIGILIVLYVSANIAYHGALSMAEMKEQEIAAEHMITKVLQTSFGERAGQIGGATMLLVIMCSTFGAINSNLLEAPRVSFAMGRDRVFFESLGRVHPDFRTPFIAIVVTALMSIALVIAAALGKFAVADVQVAGDSTAPAMIRLTNKFVLGLQQGSIFDLLTNFVVFASNLFYALGVLAVLVLRRTRPDLTRPYRTWGYPWIPIGYLAISGWFLVQVYLAQPLESHVGLFLIALGLPCYLLFRRWRPAMPNA